MNGVVAVMVLMAGSLAAQGQSPAPPPKPAFTAQVQLAVSLVEVDKACLDDLTPEKADAQSPVMVVSAERCNRFIGRLQQVEIAKVLALPIVTTEPGQTAYFNSELLHVVPKMPSGPNTPQLRPIALGVRLTPLVLEDGTVRLRIGLDHFALKPGFGVKPAGARDPAMVVSSTETTAEAKPGQIVIVSCTSPEAGGRATLVCIAPTVTATPAVVAPAPALAPHPAYPVVAAGDLVAAPAPPVPRHPPLESQVSLQVTVAEMEKACLETLGLDRPVPKAAMIVLDNERLNDFMRTRKSLGLVNVLARPSLMALAGQAATVQIGHEVPIMADTEREGVKQVNYAPVGLTLQFAPQLLDGGKFRLAAAAESSSYRETKSGKPEIVSRSLRTTADVSKGQTLVLAGLTRATDARATLVFVTPTHVTPAAAQPTAVLLGGLKSTAVVPPVRCPALPTVKATAERWQVTAEGNQLVVRQDGGASRLVVNEMVLSIAGREVRLSAFAGQVQIRCGRLDGNADRVMYESERASIILEGAARVQHLLDSVVTGDQLELDLSGTFAF
jgi:Flp pilus assembly secretin CpaC